MTSSYHPQSQSMHSKSHYSSYQTTNKDCSDDDDDDDDLHALRKAALQTLNSKKRKNTRDHSPIHRHSRSSSSSSSRSSYTHSSITRSYSSSSLSSISANSLNPNDKDYRFETKDKPSTADIDERFPNDNADMLIVDCPNLDEDLHVQDERRKSSDHNERKPRKSNPKETKSRPKSPPPIERPISITVKLNSSEFDLRQLIKKRRTEESTPINHRVVQISSKDKHLVVHKTVQDRLSSKRSDKH